MRHALALLLFVAVAIPCVRADGVDDCTDSYEPELVIKGCSAVLAGDGGDTKLRAMAHNNRGNANAMLGRADDAVADYSKALELKPGYANALHNRGLLRYHAAEHVQALEDFDAAIAAEPQFVVARHNRGAALIALGRLHEAVQAFSTALALDPQLGVAYHNRGMTKMKLGLTEEAILDLTESLRINSSNLNSRVARGELLASVSRLDDARADFEAVLRQDPMNDKARKFLEHLVTATPMPKRR